MVCEVSLGWRRGGASQRRSGRGQGSGRGVPNAIRTRPHGRHRLHRGTDMTMTRIIAIAACGLALACCSGSFPLQPSIPMTPNFDALNMKPVTGKLTVQSDPPGAEARTSQGLTCRTPCTLAVPLIEEFTVSYELNGYAPQAVSVRPMIPWAGAATVLEPNPAFAQLSSMAPPP